MTDFTHILAARLKSDFAGFSKWAFNVLHPGESLEWSPMYDLIAELLALVAEGKCPRLLFNAPPRVLKSFFFSVAYPTWKWIREPAHRFLCGSYSLDLAVDFSIQRRKLISSDWFQQLFPEIRLSDDRNRLDVQHNGRGGAMVACSVGSSVLGKGGDTLLLDDPLDPQMAASDSERKSANNWVHSVFLNRLNNPATGAVIVTGQRLHQMDTFGLLLEAEPATWRHVAVPMEAEADTDIVLPKSGRIWHRPKGDILLPQRFSTQEIQNRKAQPFIWASQNQQHPVRPEGNLLRWVDVRYWGATDGDERLPPQFSRVVISCDCSFKDTVGSDYTAIVCIGTQGSRRFVLDVVNAHLDVEGTIAAILRMRAQYPQATVLIEEAGNGSAIVMLLKRVRGIGNVIAVKPLGGKMSRFQAMCPEWAAHDWFVPRNLPWVEPFLAQLISFPAAKNDDMADACSQASSWLLQASQHYGAIYNAFTGREIPGCYH